MARCDEFNCGYCWQDEYEDYPCCHFEDDGPAPCEEDDWED